MHVIKTDPPFGSIGYQLEIHLASGKATLFPTQGFYALDPFEYPDCAAGTYRLHYCAQGGARIPEPTKLRTVEIDFGLGLKSRSPAQVEDPEQTETAPEAAASAASSTAPIDAAQLVHLDREMAQAVMAQDLEDTQQDLLYKSQYVREMAEHYAMQRLMRRDLQLMSAQFVENAKRVGDVFQHLTELHAGGMARLKKQMDEYTRPPPPPPPPDYSALGQAAIGFLRDVSVALIQKNTKGDKDDKRPATDPAAKSSTERPLSGPKESSAAKELGASEGAVQPSASPAPTALLPEAAAPSVAPVEPPQTPEMAPVTVQPPQLDKTKAEAMVRKLRRLDEGQVAALLSSPELMEKFFAILGTEDASDSASSPAAEGVAP